MFTALHKNNSPSSNLELITIFWTATPPPSTLHTAHSLSRSSPDPVQNVPRLHSSRDKNVTGKYYQSLVTQIPTDNTILTQIYEQGLQIDAQYDFM